MNHISNQFSSIAQVTDQYLRKETPVSAQPSQEQSFESILLQKRLENSELKFSKHAAMRLESRNIQLSEMQSQRLEDGVKKASEKGISDSLVMMDSLAFIVNVPSKTVVTAMDQAETDSNVFTNIDGAVIV